MNRILWRLLKAVGGKFVISNKDLEATNRTIGIRIDHIESTDTFVLQLHKIIQPKPESNIIRLSQN